MTRTVKTNIFAALPLVLLTCLAASLPGALSCKGKGADKGTGGPKARKAGPAAPRAWVANPAEAAKAWLPPQKDGSRYRVDGTPRTYDKETIFELLNGGADALLEAGLVSLLHVRIKDATEGFMDFEIQIMDVTSPGKAKAMLETEKAPQAKPESLGDAAFSEPTSLLFAKGRHLVRVTALPAGSRKAPPLADIARRIEATPAAAW